MAEHKLSYGIEIISRLDKLGKILGYHCEKEYPVDKQNESAVDVAWLFELGQQYPLFIFEVESRTTSSIPSNPLKIFGETNQKFEKPLFLFHLLLTGGQESGKISQLERVFGTYNYRIYRFSLEEEVNLVNDILSQHRRLTNKLDIVKFVNELVISWKEININNIVCHVEDLGYERGTGNILPSYAVLVSNQRLDKGHFVRLLKEKAQGVDSLYEPESYGTYFGQQWAVPIHLGLLSAFAKDDLQEDYFLKFRQWQDKSTCLKQTGPSYGLSKDYDLFVLGMSGSIFGLTAALFIDVVGAREYISSELLYIIKNSDKFNPLASLFNCVWLLHIAPRTEKGRKYFEYSKDLINQNGGIAESFYKNPSLDFMDILEGESNIEQLGERSLIPDWEEWVLFKQATVNSNPEVLFQLAINYLLSENGDWNPVASNQL